MTYRKKLIEVALPLEAINKAAAKEKSIRHGHPSTLHLWWARRPLAAARAVIFSQMVDDPSSCPEEFSTPEAQDKERQRLFRIIEDLVLWENTTNEKVIGAAQQEIRRSWRRTCKDNAAHPQAKDLFDPETLPAFHDPFAGGGALPLEAQRLGLDSYASDLNPVAVLINKAMIEIPPKFSGKPPVNPKSRVNKQLIAREWTGAQGLAEDVRYYGQWMRDEAEKRIGHLYPKIEVTADMAKERSDLKPYIGQKLTVVAWIWARTVRSPNPAFANVEVPLVSSFMLSNMKDKEAYVEPLIGKSGYRFSVVVGKPKGKEALAAAQNGTKTKRANFRCLMSGTPIEPSYLHAEAGAGRMGVKLMAIIADGEQGRVCLAPTEQDETLARDARPDWKPEVAMPENPRWFSPPLYGLKTYGDLFTPRQLVALSTFSDLVTEAREQVKRDAFGDASSQDNKTTGGSLNPEVYADAVSVMLAFTISRLADRSSNVCSWDLRDGQGRMPGIRNVFSRQAIPMAWDYAEANPLSEVAASMASAIGRVSDVLERLPRQGVGRAALGDAAKQKVSSNRVVSTDPPYYDNIGYADLSDFFYVWLRRSLKPVFPDLFATLAVPKTEELVATPYRHGGKAKAEEFFLAGMTKAMQRLAEQAHPAFPVTIYYAFKQSEGEGEDGTANTGWDTFLEAVIGSGFSVDGTWPMRTELSSRMIGSGTNALASSIVLVCRQRSSDAPSATRRQFLSALKSEIPAALAHLQRGNIAPVDVAQASIGPGMEIYSRYSKILNADGKSMPVREALQEINRALDEYLTAQEGAYDPETRFAITWYEQHQWSDGAFGEADVLSKARGVSIQVMEKHGLLRAKSGKVHLVERNDLLEPMPIKEGTPSIWLLAQYLIKALEKDSIEGAAEMWHKAGQSAELARDLAYRLYTMCERKKFAKEAGAYNGLVIAWPDIVSRAQALKQPTGQAQGKLF